MRAFGHKNGKGRPLVLVVYRNGEILAWPAKDTREANAMAKDIEKGQKPQSVCVLRPGYDDDGNDVWEG